MSSEKRFNLSEWALNNQALVRYFLILLFIGGIFSYFNLYQREDPPFTVRQMVVTVQWPGATAKQMENQVVDKIEKKLITLPDLDFVKSTVKPGMAIFDVILKENFPAKDVPEHWYQVRKKITDMQSELPEGVAGPYFNDEFSDVYTNLYAFEGDGYNYEELRRIVENVKREMLTVPGVEKADLMGVQDEQITLSLSTSKIAALGISLQQIHNALVAQNAVNPTGSFNTAGDDIPLRVTGNFDSIEQIKALPIAINGKVFRLADIAEIKREFIDPPQSKIHHNGKPAIIMGVVLNKKVDIIATGDLVAAKYAEIKTKLPIGISDAVVTNQTEVVRDSVRSFVRSLAEAVIIVMAVSFISLGLSAGIIVAITIPLVLAITFMLMQAVGVNLERISLGALIIALGLLVDDAIIAIEMMILKMEEGYGKFQAACFSYKATALPRLCGTSITAAAFIPVGLNDSSTGEYVFSLFVVVGISLMVSWLVAGVFTPYLAFKLLPLGKYQKPGEVHEKDATFKKPFYMKFIRFLDWVLIHKKIVVFGTLGVFVLSLAVFSTAVKQQFFPSSDRRELMVDMWLPQEVSIYNTESQAMRLEKLIMQESSVEYVTTFIGAGAPRYYLPLDVQSPNINFAQLLVMSKPEQREIAMEHIQKIIDAEFHDVRGRVNRLELGPPVGYPVQFRVSGPNPVELKKIALQVESIIRADSDTVNVNNDWGEDLKSLRLVVNQSKAQEIGVSSTDLELQLNMLLSGTTVTNYFDEDQTIPLVARLDNRERTQVNSILNNFMIQTATDKFVPVGQIAKLEFITEDSLKYRRNRVPTITVRADVVDGASGNDITLKLDPELKELEKKLPLGYHITYGGSQESSDKASASLNKVFPMVLILIFTLLMLQLRSIKLSLLVVASAPLGLIGVTIALLVFNAPFGFVALLGVLALMGIIMRNSVILIDQIENDLKGGEKPFTAVKFATVRRFRPILLTAAAAILGLVPLTHSPFWGPMAVAMMGGLLVATILTLVFLPALYALVYKIRPEIDGGTHA